MVKISLHHCLRAAFAGRTAAIELMVVRPGGQIIRVPVAESFRTRCRRLTAPVHPG